MNLLSEEIRVTSLDVARITGRMHKHVLRDIRVIVGQLQDEEFGPNFGSIDSPSYLMEESTYKDNRGRYQKMFILGKNAALLVGMKMCSKIAVQVIEHIHKLEEIVFNPERMQEIAYRKGRTDGLREARDLLKGQAQPVLPAPVVNLEPVKWSEVAKRLSSLCDFEWFVMLMV